VAHEINTPLGVLSLGASVLETTLSRDLDACPPAIREALTLMQQNIARLARLVQTFRSLSAETAGATCQRVDLLALLEEVDALCRRTGRGLAIEVHCALPEAERVWMGCPEILSQVLVHLVRNAEWHAYPGGAEAARVALRLWRGPGRFQIEVRDFGCGIATQDLWRIFEPFFTTERGRGAAGLGLTIVHNLVTAGLRGHVDVASKIGEGTAFRVCLPAPGVMG
jgi:signal transduction histidine kinase